MILVTDVSNLRYSNCLQLASSNLQNISVY